MKKILSLFIITATLLTLCACSAQGSEIKPGGSPDEGIDSSPSPSDLPAPSEQVTEPPVEETAEPEDWQAIFTQYLEDNYDALVDALVSPVAGIGFIDLDLDKNAELIIFDVGASAAMGVHIFDIIDDEVVCVSSSRLGQIEGLGEDYESSVYIQANSTEEFRLLQDENGNKLFVIESGNGNSEFLYRELFLFEKRGGTLTPVSILYKSVEYDENGEESGGTYENAGKPIDESTYESLYSDIFQNNVDTGYEAKGVFIWGLISYDVTYEGCMEMLKEALSLYEPAI